MACLSHGSTDIFMKMNSESCSEFSEKNGDSEFTPVSTKDAKLGFESTPAVDHFW